MEISLIWFWNNIGLRSSKGHIPIHFDITLEQKNKLTSCEIIKLISLYTVNEK